METSRFMTVFLNSVYALVMSGLFSLTVFLLAVTIGLAEENNGVFEFSYPIVLFVSVQILSFISAYRIPKKTWILLTMLILTLVLFFTLLTVLCTKSNCVGVGFNFVVTPWSFRFGAP